MILSVIFMETLGAQCNKLSERSLVLRQLGLKDVVAFLRNLPSATFYYFLEGFNLVTV